MHAGVQDLVQVVSVGTRGGLEDTARDTSSPLDGLMGNQREKGDGTPCPELALALRPRIHLLPLPYVLCSLLSLFCLPPVPSWETVLSPEHLCPLLCPCEVTIPFVVLALPCLPSRLGLPVTGSGRWGWVCWLETPRGGQQKTMLALGQLGMEGLGTDGDWKLGGF